VPESGEIQPLSPDIGRPNSGKNWPEYCRISTMVRSRPDLGKMVRILQDPTTDLARCGQNDRDLAGFGRVRLESDQTCRLKSGNGDRTLPDSCGICQTLIFTFRASQIRKYFTTEIILSRNKRSIKNKKIIKIKKTKR